MRSLSEYLLERAVASSDGLPVELPWKRRDLPRLTRKLGFRKGAEIGVWKGDFSAHFCRSNPRVHMLCIDPWTQYEGWVDPKGVHPDSVRMLEGAHREAVTRLSGFYCTIIRARSTEAARDVSNRSLDFVYIDGNHGYDAVLQDLAVWSKKIRPGGFLSGHDYRESSAKPSIEVKAAVDAFTRQRGIDPWFILTGDRTPSFIWEIR
jgi:hypothetical protein